MPRIVWLKCTIKLFVLQAKSKKKNKNEKQINEEEKKHTHD